MLPRRRSSQTRCRPASAALLLFQICQSRAFSSCISVPILAGLDDAGILQDSAITVPKKTPPCFQDGVVAILAFLLRMDFPHAAAEAGDAQETRIRCDIDIVDFNERQAGAKAAPAHSAVDGAINAQERSCV